jgi:hypothetical protein
MPTPTLIQTKLSTKIIIMLSVLMLFALSTILIPAPNANAASKTLELSTSISSDDPYVNISGQKVSELDVDLSTPLDVTKTQIDSVEDNETSGPWGYTWHINMPDMCEGTQFQSIRLITDSETQNESPLSGIFLALYGGSLDELEFRDDYTVNNGYGADLDWFPVPYPTPAVERGIGDGENYFPSSLGFDGVLDVSWDITDYILGNTLGIYVQHWIADGSTTIAQTTIESVTLTYDDSACSSTTLTTPLTNTTTSYLVLPSSASNASFTTTPASTVPKDSTYSYPGDLVSFQFDTTSPGDTETITLYYDLPGSPSDYEARKYNTITQEFSTINNASITRTTYNNQSMLKLTYDITDGGVLDQDGEANGTIVDPVGLATTNAVLADTGINTTLINLIVTTTLITSLVIARRYNSTN